MNANDAPPNLTDQTQGCVPRSSPRRGWTAAPRPAPLIKPADLYTLADRVEETARRQGERPSCCMAGSASAMPRWTPAPTRWPTPPSPAACARATCALAMENRPDFFTWFGLTKLGVVVAFINTQVSGRPLVHALETTQARAAVVGEECLANFAATEGLPTCPCGARRCREAVPGRGCRRGRHGLHRRGGRARARGPPAQPPGRHHRRDADPADLHLRHHRLCRAAR